MIKSDIVSIYKVDTERNRFNQGDVLCFDTDENIELLGVEYNFKYLFILSQDCDLLWDYNARNNASRSNDDKIMEYILVGPAFFTDSVLAGTHIEGKKMAAYSSSTRQDSIKNNNDKRFHSLPSVNSDTISLPNLTLDFKFYFCIPTKVLYEKFNKFYCCTLNDLFRNSLTQRFANFLSRIGLPEIQE